MYHSINQIKEIGRRDLIDSILFLADSNLILSQRQSEWTGHGPVLEQDIAITNINLDLLGQSRLFYQYAASLINDSTGSSETEDSLAYLRTERDFKNLLICELPNGDWAQTVLRLFFYSVYSSELYTQLEKGPDTTVSSIAAKSLKEIAYHVKWSSEWVLRLGDGTEESHNRIKEGLQNLWPYTGEFFVPGNFENVLNVDYSTVKHVWQNRVNAILQEATLEIPSGFFMQLGGKDGIHTEHLGYMLAEMQYLQRTYPGAEW